MNCPNCGTTLLMSNRSGVEIDYCPQCRGIWLDKGELDKLLEREQTDINTRSARPLREKPLVEARRTEDYDDDYDYSKRKNDENYGRMRGISEYDDDRYPDKRYKKKSLLGEIFDIFD